MVWFVETQNNHYDFFQLLHRNPIPNLRIHIQQVAYIATTSPNSILHKSSPWKYQSKSVFLHVKILVNAITIINLFASTELSFSLICKPSFILTSHTKMTSFLIILGPRYSGTNSHSRVNPVVLIGYIFPTIEASFYIEHNRHKSHFKNIIFFLNTQWLS